MVAEVVANGGRGALRSRCCRWALRAACVLALGAAANVFAAAADAYQAALKSYRDGDVVGALPRLREAADAGHAKAQALLAELLDRAEFDAEAIAYYRLAAAQNEPDGLFGYGVMLAAGEGLAQKDAAAARGWIEQAAALGHAQAINVVAQAYLKGELGLGDADRRSPEALRWAVLAAKNDFLPAVDALADAYRGGGGLPVAADTVLAADYLAQGNRLRGIVAGKKKTRRVGFAPAPPR